MVISRPLQNGSTSSLEEEVSLKLIAQAQAGKHTAFESIYRGYVGRVYALSLRMLGDRGWAEDVTQKIFVRAWTKLNSFRAESRFSSWLYRLAVNVILGELKLEERRKKATLNLDEIRQQAAITYEKHQMLLLDCEKAIALLPQQARVIFVLHDIEGFTHAEIAQMMRLAVGTCKAHLSRARKLLREALTL